MVEPLEETRYELIFATEPLLSSLFLAIPTPGHPSPLVELDEVEVRAVNPTFSKIDISILIRDHVLDSKGDPTALQRPRFLAYIYTPHPLQS